ncbi:MAG: hypothetical protein QGF67_15905 [Lentisphaeria bacterium]|jgi:hypothetical protein|nr:hypothetical protein [Lentisphaeria bacterium]MDP7742924.1 hypothetical protein [Lentisphaeria bacterium]
MSRVAITISPDAGVLARDAATLLQSYLQEIFAVEALLDGSADWQIIVGQVDDPLVQQASPALPALPGQGYLLRRVDETAMLLAGGSDAATAWAVYDFLERLGVRFLLSGDVLPKPADEFRLPEVDATFEPVQRLRSWRMICELPYGPIMWSLDEQRRVIGQLHKLKFNGLHFSLWPPQPFIHFEVDGIKRQTVDVLQKHRIPIDPDTPGHESLGICGSPMLPPWLAGAESYEEWLVAGQRFLNSLIDEAEKYGMHTSLGFQPFEFTKEFAPLLENPTTHQIQSGNLTCAEQADLMNPQHLKMFNAVTAAHLETWARCDEFMISFPEHPHAERKFAESWQAMAKRFALEPRFNIDQMLAAAEADELTIGGTARAVREFKSNISMIWLLRQVLGDSGFLERAAANSVDVGVSMGGGVRFAFPVLGEVLWPNATAGILLDYTPSASLRRLHHLAAVDTGKIKARLTLTFQDDNVGWVPTVESESNHILLRTAAEAQWQGYTTRYWPIGDLDPAVNHLARTSWNSDYAPRQAFADHAEHVLGGKTVDRFCDVMRLFDDATIILDLSFTSLLFPVRMIMKRYYEATEPMRNELFHIRASFVGAMRLFGDMEEVADVPGAAERIAYWIGRLRFSIAAIDEIRHLCDGGVAVAKAETAREAGDVEAMDQLLAEARNCFDRGMAAGRSGLEAVAPVVQDSTDRAALAAYYDFMVRFVKLKTAEILAAADSD